ncbi:oxidoreductase FAD/NAD(P)-binding protein [Photobacterium marinum]|uniref:Oxidoreductase FAD/NAD(P)-binding protein n=1 Tax=Photobacterium marinum TaxID=1056511 RepID=L8JF88_9GAMM|nr:FAD-binding oxidoreductase [Photobacterium marinum]ELR66903.1 oxidoreductase FAD/NAD(P)-binding protein [Photobacterium marinum]
MHSLTPTAIQLIDFYDDGELARHFHFRLMPGADIDQWQKAKTGQYFMLCLPNAGEAPFTFTQLPDEEGNFHGLVRKMGTVTSELFRLEAGQVLGARGPYGVGWPMKKIAGKRVLVVGGGCGLAPLVGVVDELIQQQNYIQLTVVYGARNRQAKMLNRERTRWQQFIPVFNMIENGDTNGDESEYSGTPSDIMPTVLDSFGELPDVVLLAGPEGMMFSLAEYLVAYGVSEHSIYMSVERRMHCGVGTCGHCYAKSKYVCTDGPTFSWDELQQYLPAER